MVYNAVIKVSDEHESACGTDSKASGGLEPNSKIADEDDHCSRG
jgi:hypothetical protein